MTLRKSWTVADLKAALAAIAGTILSVRVAVDDSHALIEVDAPGLDLGRDA